MMNIGTRRSLVVAGVRAAAIVFLLAMVSVRADGDELAPPSGHPLADSSWRLIELQSMSDEHGVTRPADPSQYIMHLGADGTVTIQLDCNRATGTWMADAASDVVSGHFRFGPLAATTMACPPPTLGETLAAQAQWIRGYLVRDGNLYLSMMADGGIWAWEPLGKRIAFRASPDAGLEEAIRAAAPGYTRTVVERFDHPARYIHAGYDVDNDGEEEVFVYLLGPHFCGTSGCNLMLFDRTPGGYRLVHDFPISRTPVLVQESATEGWHDLVRLESGGGVPASMVRHVFDGNGYVEAERLPADASPGGVEGLVGDFTFEDGALLEPAR